MEPKIKQEVEEVPVEHQTPIFSNSSQNIFNDQLTSSETLRALELFKQSVMSDVTKIITQVQEKAKVEIQKRFQCNTAKQSHGHPVGKICQPLLIDLTEDDEEPAVEKETLYIKKNSKQVVWSRDAKAKDSVSSCAKKATSQKESVPFFNLEEIAKIDSSLEAVSQLTSTTLFPLSSSGTNLKRIKTGDQQSCFVRSVRKKTENRDVSTVPSCSHSMAVASTSNLPIMKAKHEICKVCKMEFIDKSRLAKHLTFDHYEFFKTIGTFEITKERQGEQNTTDGAKSVEDVFIKLSNIEIHRLSKNTKCLNFVRRLLTASYPNDYFLRHDFDDITPHQLQSLFDITASKFTTIKRHVRSKAVKLSISEFTAVVKKEVANFRVPKFVPYKDDDSVSASNYDYQDENSNFDSDVEIDGLVHLSAKELKTLTRTSSYEVFIERLLLASFPKGYFLDHTFAAITPIQLDRLYDIFVKGSSSIKCRFDQRYIPLTKKEVFPVIRKKIQSFRSKNL